MSKLDSYLRSIEKFGAVGAILTSGQAVTLRFPTGDRQATQVTPHELLVGLVREVAPPAVLDLVDKHRPARFEIDSNGNRYAVNIASRPGAWQVAIEAVAAPPPGPASYPSGLSPHATARASDQHAVPQAAAMQAQARPRPTQPAPMGELTIERGQYDAPAAVEAVGGASASAVLDQLTHAARAGQAIDLYLAAGARPLQRAAGENAMEVGAPMDAETLSRELGSVAPAEARAAWQEKGHATFAYSDGAGWVRVGLGRDRGGPTAALRLLPDGPPELGQIGLTAAEKWLHGGGLVLVTGPAGSGKTLALAALVRAVAELGRRVVSVEDPIEIAHAGPWVSQRGVGTHVGSVAEGVRAAMREGADAIALGDVPDGAAAGAVVDAAAAGHLVLAACAAPVAAMALERLIGEVPADRREVARAMLEATWLATVRPVLGRNGRTFEISARDQR
ncbi:MAG: Flp pilus assembly complex ATPase component TadA [Deltaproteobacteria bacterium]|nr:Flp pilus assembly complex ATPase component TadA [Deltaproteobacteria bacterium]